jgi:hypothetical protein
MTPGQADRVLYVVHRIGWVERYEGGYVKVARESRGHPKRVQGRPVGAFTDREQAEAFRREQECLITAGKNPLDYADGGDLFFMTTMDEDVFADVVQDLGLPRPQKIDEDWHDWDAWWAEHGPKMNAEQQAGVWRYLDRIQFFQIVEVPLS